MEKNIGRMLWLLGIVFFVVLWVLFNDAEFSQAAYKYIIFIGAVFLIIVYRKKIKWR